LSALSNADLVGRLGDPSVLVREQATRLLGQRNCADVVPVLEQLVSASQTPMKQRMHAMYALVSGRALSEEAALRFCNHTDPSVRAWAVRGGALLVPQSTALAAKIASMAEDTSPDVLLQVAIAAGKLKSIDAVAVWVQVLSHSGNDKLIPRIVWQNLHPRLPAQTDRLLSLAEKVDLEKASGLAELLTHVAEKQ
jgi:HEAT repeat protein